MFRIELQIENLVYSMLDKSSYVIEYILYMICKINLPISLQTHC